MLITFVFVCDIIFVMKTSDIDVNDYLEEAKRMEGYITRKLVKQTVTGI